MHIPEGLLSAPVLAGGALLTAAGTMIGLQGLDSKKIINTAFLAAVFFVGSLVPVPLFPGISSHLSLNGLMGIILGRASIPAICVALLLQALLFQHGGLTVLGVNVLIMAGPALVVYFLLGNWLKRPGKRKKAAFLAGCVAVLLSALLMAMFMALSDQEYVPLVPWILLMHLPLMIIEGFITMFIVDFLQKVRPEMLEEAI